MDSSTFTRSLQFPAISCNSNQWDGIIFTLVCHSLTSPDGYLNRSDLNIVKFTTAMTQIIEGEGLVTTVLKAVLIPLCVIILVIITIVILVWVRWYRRSKMAIAEFHPEAVSHAYMSVYTLALTRGKHEKEFPLTKLKIIRALGEGAFGVVSQAVAEGIIEKSVLTDVAVKQLHTGSSEADEFFREVDFMSGLDHPNIVTLLGERYRIMCVCEWGCVCEFACVFASVFTLSRCLGT